MILGTAASTPTSPSTLQQHPGAEILYVPKNASVGLEKDLWLFSPISGYIPSPTLPCPLSPPSSCKAPFAGITHKKPHRQMPGQKNTTAFPSCVFRNTLSRERWAWSCLCCLFSRSGNHLEFVTGTSQGSLWVPLFWEHPRVCTQL